MDIKNPVICVHCGEVYDYITEPQEVKEGSEHICSGCWAKEE
jgi:formylmethanofuran dehydrogenase subunit E